MCLWRDMLVYFAVPASGRSVAVSPAGGIHWRLLSSDTQLLGLLWMAGHMFELYHICQYLSFVLVLDRSS